MITAVSGSVPGLLGWEDLTEPHAIRALLDPAADAGLPAMAREAFRRTLQYFGRTIKLYAPLYLSNYCVNTCPYCGFSKQESYAQKVLSLDEVRSEASIIAATGIRDILLVAGEDPDHVTVDYLARTVEAVKAIVPAVSIETAPFTEAEYRTLNAAGVDGVTLYQETYDRPLYERLHKGGNKADYDYRYESLFRAGRAGIRRLGAGTLLGLYDWRAEARALFTHALAIERACWKSIVSVSFPRINPCLAGFEPLTTVTDRDLVHMICAARLVLPQSDLVLSTRENAAMRDRILGIGITRMSAGSRTSPGGYGTSDGETEQFAIHDDRSAAAIAAALIARGFEPVWQDWEECMK